MAGKNRESGRGEPKRAVCPACERETEVEPVKKTVTVRVRKEEIEVPVTFLRCKECGYDEIEDRENPVDELDLAYREYRRRHGMLQPEEITALRKQYGMSQRDFAEALGLSPATLSRYETGGLQEAAHDHLLRLLRDPRNMLWILENNSSPAAEKARSKALEALDKSRGADIERKLKARNEDFSLERFKNIVCYAVNEIERINRSPNKSRLIRVLRRLDADTDFTKIIYEDTPRGPYPTGIDEIILLMEKEGSLIVKEFFYTVGNAEAVDERLYASPWVRASLTHEEKERIRAAVAAVCERVQKHAGGQ